MPILIDGWNLIRNDSSDIDDTYDDPLDCADRLIGYLEDYQRTHNDPVIAVFDSKSGHLDIPFEDTPKLKVVAAKDADAYIKKYIDRVPERQRPNVRVVSSDKDIFFYAKSSSAVPMRSEEFWEKMRR